MYPRINTGAPGVLQVPSSGNANAYYPTVGMQGSPGFSQHEPASGYSNGPAASGGSPTSQNFPLLRVQIADQYRTLPPVMVSPGLDNIQQSSFSYNFDYERRVEAEVNAATNKSSAAGDDQNTSSSQGAASVQVEDPWTSEVLKYTEIGFSREEVCMALAALGTSADKDDEFMDFCKNYRELRSMGFPKATVAGALLVHKNDFEAATEACLAAQ